MHRFTPAAINMYSALDFIQQQIILTVLQIEFSSLLEGKKAKKLLFIVVYKFFDIKPLENVAIIGAILPKCTLWGVRFTKRVCLNFLVEDMDFNILELVKKKTPPYSLGGLARNPFYSFCSI